MHKNETQVELNLLQKDNRHHHATTPEAHEAIALIPYL
jgi:hypothetical protein